MAKKTVGGPGVYNAQCDVCSFEYKNYELRQRWDGKMVCKYDWEPRHILDFYQTKDDSSKLPWTRPEVDGPDIGPPLNPGTVTPLPCTVAGSTSYVGVAVVGCSIVGRTAGYP